jgi:alpha-glucoside transport system permease protein
MIVFLWTIPTFGLLISSFRPEAAIKTTGWWTFFSHPELTLKNYREVLAPSAAQGQMGQYFINSVKIALPGTIIPVLIAAFAAYAFSWMSFKGRDWLFVAVIGLLVVPLQMALIPLLQLFNGGAHIGSITVFPALSFLRNNVSAIWLAHTCFALPLAVFLLRNFIGQLPGELMEAARVDGASHLTIFTRIVIPLSVPALASLTIFQFLWVWNDYLVGYVFAGNTPPLQVKLVDIAGSRGEDWQRLTAAAFVTMIVPLAVFFSLQRFFVRGLVTGAVKA